MSKTQIETGQSRRAFLKTGAGLAAGAALPAAASAQGGQAPIPSLTACNRSAASCSKAAWC